VIPGGEFDVLMADETFEFVRGTVDFMELFEKIVIMAESRRDDSARITARPAAAAKR
jgi:hypothetical protein